MNHFEVESLLARGSGKGNEWLPFLEPSTLSLGLYVVRADDQETHKPHDRDEVYYVVRGRGSIRSRGGDQRLGPGSVIFVPAHQEHHFHGIEEELVLLVFFSNADIAR